MFVKNAFTIILELFRQLIGQTISFFTIGHKEEKNYTWFLLDVNPKTRFLEVQEIIKEKEKCLPQIFFLEWFCYTTIDPICFHEGIIINQRTLLRVWSMFVFSITNSTTSLNSSKIIEFLTQKGKTYLW